MAFPRWLLPLAAPVIAASCSPSTDPVPPSTPPSPTPSASTSVAPQHPKGPRAFVDPTRAREDIDGQFKWDLSPLFATDEQFEAALKQATSQRAELIQKKGKLAKPAALRDALELYFSTRHLTNRLTLYANLRLDTDSKSPLHKGQNDRALGAMSQLIEQSAFLRSHLLELDDRALALAYKADAKLRTFEPYITELRRRKSRLRSPETERVLALAGDNLWAEIDLNELPSDHEKTFDAMISDLSLPTITDETGKSVKLSVASYEKYRSSSNRTVRQAAVDALFGALRQHEDVFAATLGGQVRQNILFARARGYSTALHAYLDKDNIDTAVYESLEKTIADNVAPLHRYMSLRKRVMNVPELRIHDLYVPLLPAHERRFTYQEGGTILQRALAPLGEEYGRVLAHGLDPKNGWVDLFPHKNKRSGAFCSSVWGIHPFIKMNYFEDGKSLSTLAHEFGHALHSHLANQTQPYITASYSAFTAEIASTINEKLLIDHLLAEAKSDRERLTILADLVEKIRTTIYRQTIFATFEHTIHTEAERGTPLTPELLTSIYGKLIKHYYGPEFVLGPNDAVEWAYIPHFYYKYYVFSYATGFSAGLLLADKIQTGGPSARDAYLGMLKAGSSKPPLTLLREAGVDLTRRDAMESAARLLDATITKMEAILAERQ